MCICECIQECVFRVFLEFQRWDLLGFRIWRREICGFFLGSASGVVGFFFRVSHLTLQALSVVGFGYSAGERVEGRGCG